MSSAKDTTSFNTLNLQTSVFIEWQFKYSIMR